MDERRAGWVVSFVYVIVQYHVVKLCGSVAGRDRLSLLLLFWVAQAGWLDFVIGLCFRVVRGWWGGVHHGLSRLLHRDQTKSLNLMGLSFCASAVLSFRLLTQLVFPMMADRATGRSGWLVSGLVVLASWTRGPGTRPSLAIPLLCFCFLLLSLACCPAQDCLRCRFRVKYGADVLAIYGPQV